MKRQAVAAVAVFLLLSVTTSAECIAQRGRGRTGAGGWGAGSVYNRMYDVRTVETIAGEVTRVDEFVPIQGVYPGIHITLATDSESVSVHLGPAWFLENQDGAIVVGDAVIVTGSRIVYQGAPAIIAASVQRDDQVLQLRDPRGVPVWSGWRRW